MGRMGLGIDSLIHLVCFHLTLILSLSYSGLYKHIQHCLGVRIHET